MIREQRGYYFENTTVGSTDASRENERIDQPPTCLTWVFAPFQTKFVTFSTPLSSRKSVTPMRGRRLIYIVHPTSKSWIWPYYKATNFRIFRHELNWPPRKTQVGRPATVTTAQSRVTVGFETACYNCQSLYFRCHQTTYIGWSDVTAICGYNTISMLWGNVA